MNPSTFQLLGSFKMLQVIIFFPKSIKIKEKVTKAIEVECFFLLCPGQLSMPTDRRKQ